MWSWSARLAWSNSSSRICSASSAVSSLSQKSLHPEQPLGGDEGGGDLAERGAFLLGEREGRGDSEPVDQPVGDLGGDDLAAQAMLEDGVALALLHRLREGVAQFGRQRRILGDLAGLERRLQRHFRGGEEDGELGPGEAAILLRPAHQLLVRFEALDGAVEAAAFLEHLDRPDQRRQAGGAAALGDRQGQSLQAIVLEHELGDLVGHLGEQGVAVVEAEPAFRHLAVERDLDVDLVVRAVDAGRIVDEVGVDPPAERWRTRPGRPG